MATYVRLLAVSSERASELRITVAVAQLLALFLADDSQPRYGYELMHATGFPSGKLYPILGRMTHAGWLTRAPEDIDPAKEGRPARYMYRLTERGTRQARYELAALQQKTALPPRLVPRLSPLGGQV